MNSGPHVTRPQEAEAPFAPPHLCPSESLPPAQANVPSSRFRECAQKQADSNYHLHCACTVPTRIAPPQQADEVDSSLIIPILQMKQLVQPLGQGCLTCKGGVRPGAQVFSLQDPGTFHGTRCLTPCHLHFNREEAFPPKSELLMVECQAWARLVEVPGAWSG